MSSTRKWMFLIGAALIIFLVIDKRPAYATPDKRVHLPRSVQSEAALRPDRSSPNDKAPNFYKTSVKHLTRPADSSLDKIPWERGIKDGRYIKPNELQFFNFSKALRGKKGALISVGTFRTFQDAAMGDFSEVISIDLDQEIISHNKIQLDLIMRASDRFHWLELMSGIPGLAEKVRKYDAGKLSTEKLKSYISKHDLRDPFVESLMGFLLDRGTYPETFFGSDKAFNKLKRLQAEGRFHFICASISGNKSMKKVADILRRNGTPVSVVDVSNAPEYLAESDHPKRDIKGFLRNFKALPVDETSAVLFTAKVTPNIIEKGWGYFQVGLEEYINDLEGHLLEKRSRAKTIADSYEKYFAGLEPLPIPWRVLLKNARLPLALAAKRSVPDSTLALAAENLSQSGLALLLEASKIRPLSEPIQKVLFRTFAKNPAENAAMNAAEIENLMSLHVLLAELHSRKRLSPSMLSSMRKHIIETIRSVPDIELCFHSYGYYPWLVKSLFRDHRLPLDAQERIAPMLNAPDGKAFAIYEIVLDQATNGFPISPKIMAVLDEPQVGYREKEYASKIRSAIARGRAQQRKTIQSPPHINTLLKSEL
jgi:hypothetical protein